MRAEKTRARRDWVIGLILIVLGLLFFAEQLFDFSFGDVLWPLFVLLPGLILFGLMATGGEGLNFLAIPAAMISMVGLLLFYQNLFDHFESWSYAWALVFPTSFGFGLYLYGSRTGNENTKITGKGFIRVGLIIFVVAAGFFELVIGISNSSLSRYGLPALLILLGVFLLFRRGGSGAQPAVAPVEPPGEQVDDAVPDAVPDDPEEGDGEAG